MMRNTHISKLIKLLTVFALFFCPGFSQASNFVSNFETLPAVEKMPPKVGTWKYTPTVIICDYAPVEETRVRSAVAYWQRHGFRFFNTIYKRDVLKKCQEPAPNGFIVVRLVTQEMHSRMEESTLAETHFYVDNNRKEIEWAKIYLRGTPKERVLEHEIGHALGFLHYNQQDHLMHEKWPLGGWGHEGLYR
jgi:hypothetical protein